MGLKFLGQTIDEKRAQERARGLNTLKAMGASQAVLDFHYGNRKAMKRAEKYLLRNCK